MSINGRIICGADGEDFTYTIRRGWTDIPTQIPLRQEMTCNVRLFVGTPVVIGLTKLDEGEWMCVANVRRSRSGEAMPFVVTKIAAFMKMDESKRRLFAPTP